MDQFYVLNGIRPGLERHSKNVSNPQISGGGHLYVHINSGAAFYSQNGQINIAIDEHTSRGYPNHHKILYLRSDLRTILTVKTMELYSW